MRTIVLRLLRCSRDAMEKIATKGVDKMKIPLLAALLLISTPVIAAESSWEDDKALLKTIASQDLSGAEKCRSTWTILWPWAKKGNLEARAALLLDMSMHFREFPGRSGDAISRIRDATVLAVHSVNDQENEITDAFYQSIRQLEQIAGRDEFLECIEQDRSPDCARIAVEKKLVPSFEDFAAEVDTFLDQGKESTCVYGAH